jgi:protein SCO1
MRGYRRWLGSVAIVALLALLPACGSKDRSTSVRTSPSGSDPTALVGKQAPDFSLVDQFGHRQQLSEYRGKVVLLTFISSHCTDICPLTAEMLSRTRDLLGSKAHGVQLVAVNANTVFRSVGAVRRWSELHSMTHRWVFLTGSVPQLTSVFTDYSVQPGSAHTTVIFLIDAQGRIRTLVPIAMKSGLDAEARLLAKYVGKVESS